VRSTQGIKAKVHSPNIKVSSLSLKGNVGAIKSKLTWVTIEVSMITRDGCPSGVALNISAGSLFPSRNGSVSALYFSLKLASFTVNPLLSWIRLSKKKLSERLFVSMSKISPYIIDLVYISKASCMFDHVLQTALSGMSV